MLNKRGPRIEPWGTPLSTVAKGDLNSVSMMFCVDLLVEDSVIEVNCILLERYDWNHLYGSPLTPMQLSLLRRISWLTVSKALVRSQNIEAVCLLAP